MDSYNSLLHKFQDRSAKTAVIGLGYVGLPLAVLHARAGFTVTGIERTHERVRSVNEGRGYTEEVSDDDLRPLVQNGRLHATSDFSGIAESDVVAICVPTPLDSRKQPDTSYIEYVLEQSSPYWHAGQLIILESTTYPGTTNEILFPHLDTPDLRVGADIFVAYSPERIDPGNRTLPINEIPRIVGGITPRCTELAQRFYQQILDAPVTSVSSPKVAEMAKLFENVFRVVNVSLVNELAQLCERMGIDVWEVIEAAKTKPYGFMPFYPGPGVGGHCIPIDPFYLSWKARQFGFATRFIELAGDINDNMPRYVVSRITEILNKHSKSVNGSKILMSGITFKRNVSDLRESASLKIGEDLLRRGAAFSYHDPHVPSVTIDGAKYDSVQLTTEELGKHDLVVIGTDHSDVDYRLIAEASRLIYDTRNAIQDLPAKHIYRLGAPEPA